MPTSQWLPLIFLVAASAFFSASETALMGISHLRLRALIEAGQQRARLVAKLKQQPEALLIALLVGNNLVNIGASSLFTALMLQIFGPGRAITIATGVMTVVILVFGEIGPKTMAARHPLRVAYRVAKPVSILMRFLSPLVYVLTGLANFLTRLVPGGEEQTEQVTEAEIRTLVNVGEEQGIIEDDESRMIHSVLALTDTPVRNIMVPRTAMTAVEVNTNHDELIAIIRRDRYSRLPVYEGDIDNIIGLLHAKDICSLTEEEKAAFDLRQLLRPTIFVVSSKASSLVLRELQKHRIYMAIIIDEYGGTAGLVTIEDLIEEIVGEIVDEYDVEDPPVEVYDAHTTFLDARLTVEEVNEQLNLALPTDRALTIGGLIYDLLGRIPRAGESVSLGGVQLTVDKIDRRTIERVKLTIKQ
ncbi:MAG: HlyC/CorC family transporter [Firmicutes bacterium]|nr:HlyC/CorC family transporter [Bacillota bacterium]